MSDDPEARLHRYRRAKEVLDGAGWVFDDYVNARMREVLTSNPDDVEGRERSVRAARVAAQLKTGLLREVEEYEADEALAERREQIVEKRHGRHAVN